MTGVDKCLRHLFRLRSRIMSAFAATMPLARRNNSLRQTKAPDLSAGRFCMASGYLGALDVLGVRALLAVDHLEGDGVADMQVGKRNARQVVGVEEEVLRLSIASDEAESLIRNEGLDCSLIHENSF